MVRVRPVVEGDAVFLSADDGLHRLDARDGRTRWTHGLDEWTARSLGWHPVPAVARDVVVLCTGGRVDALDARTGARRWSLDSLTVRSEPVIVDDMLYVVGSGLRNLLAVEATSGSLRWRTTVSGARPVRLDDGVVLVVGSTVQARDRDGTRRWTCTGMPAVPSSITVAGGRVYVAVADHLVALDAADGRRLWRSEALPLRGRDALPLRGRDALPLRGLPAPADDVVLLPSADGVVAIASTSGALRWSMPGATAPFVVSGIAYVTDNGGLSAVDPSSGEVIWHAEAASMLPSPQVVDGSVYLVTGGQVQAHRVDDGRLRWVTSGIFALSTPVVAGGIVYVEDGYTLSAIDADTGRGPSTVGGWDS